MVDVEHSEACCDESNEEEHDLERDFSLFFDGEDLHLVFAVDACLCEAVARVVVGVVSWVEVLLPLFRDVEVVSGVSLPLGGGAIVGLPGGELGLLSSVDGLEVCW